MNSNSITPLRTSMAKAGKSANHLTHLISRPPWSAVGLALLACFLCAPVHAQITPWVRFTTSQLRATVPINSSNSIVITNFVNVSTDIVSAVNFSVSGLPAGATATLTDTNGNDLLSTMNDTNLWLTLNLTNIAEGIYTFYLQASGGATNQLPLVLQVAHVWNGANGAMEVSNLLWSAATNWLGGVPGPTSDVVFGEIGAQTNADEGGGFPFTNSIVDVSTTIGSLRFFQTGFTNSIATVTNNSSLPRFHTMRLNPGVTLTVSGSNGFSVLRDYIGERYVLPRMGINFSGGAGSKLVVSNETGNFGMLIDLNTTEISTLNVSNLETFVMDVNRFGVGEYQIYPNYFALNDGFNQGRDTNQYVGFPRRFPINLMLARTNIIKAVYKDPNNYTNENTRGYAISQFNGEQSGNGSSLDTFFILGVTNVFLADSVCFIGANHASGNNGGVRFGTNNATALFRATNGGRMSLFVIADDGGTNQASSNVKANIDFSQLNSLVDILADKFYVSRDRTLIRSNDNPTSESTLTLGRGIIDANTAILGFQEHSNKVDWTAFGAQVYRGYCVATLNVTNGGTFRVNGNLTLGYTADTNPENDAQQYNTRGQINIFSNSTVTASNILVDTGLNFTSLVNPRQNNITINASGILTATNGIGTAPGLPLDNLNIGAGGILTVFVTPGKTNIIVKNLTSSGATPGIIKIASLPAFPSYPTNVPIISYQAANPFLAADMSAVGGTVQGYIVNDSANKTIDLFLTTNAPKSLTWSGNINNNWDLTTKNWLTTNGISTNFTFGDIVTFDDSSSVTSVSITDVVVPNQATNGVIFNNSSRAYTFSYGGGAVAGTAKLVKQGNGNVTFNASESGPITVAAGRLNGAGILGSVTVYSNAALSLDASGTINGGVISTGSVAIASGATIASGAVSIRGGTFDNSGSVNASGSMSINGGALVTNEANAEIDVDTGSSGGNWVASGGCVIANYGTIKEVRGRLNLAPTGAPFDGATLFGPGQFLDSDGGLITGNDGRLAINPSALWSPGTNLYNSIGTTFVQARVDLNNTPASGVGVLRIEVDFNNPQTNDIVIADKWNNITGMLLMTNINPGAGSFAPGQVFQVFSNTASSPGFPFPNFIDVNGTYPIMSPVVPGPGLQWGLLDFRTYGTVSVTNSPLVWDGGINGNWDTNTANWKSGNIYSDGQGAMLDDSASGTTTITLTNIIAPIGFILVTNIVPNVSTNVITNNPVMSPGLVVSNSAKDYTISGSGKISGMTGLYKIGSGALNLLNTTNDFTGNVIINGGTVAVSNPPAPSATIASLGINGSGGINNEIFIDGGTLKYIGLTNAALSRSMSIGSGGATLNVNSATNELTAGTIWGAGGLTKIGPGTVVLTANANTFAGGIAINSGTVRMTSAAAGSGTISVGANTSLVLTNTYNFTNAMNIAGAGTTILLYANTNVSGGAWSGAGTTTVSGTNTGQLIVNASMAGLSGVVSLGSSANSIRFNNSTNSNPNTGSTAGTYDLGTGSGALWNLNGNGLTYNLGALSGGPNTILFGSSTNMGVPACTYSIGANGSNTVFSGRITNGVGAVTVAKVGSGSLGLAGNNTYSGGTLVNGGTLLVNNTAGSGTGSGSVSVGSGATLGGNGAIGGAVSVASGGTLSPGTSIGRLTINNSLSLAGTTFIEVSKNGSALTNDNVAGLTSVSFGGALVVTNLGPTALAAGDSFQLFNIGGPGNFTSLTPALASPLAWSFNPVNGVLSVIDIRPVLTFSRSGNTVQLNWTGASKLQAQTNGITGPWFDYPGGAAGPVTVTIDPNQTDVFFRLAPSP